MQTGLTLLLAGILALGAVLWWAHFVEAVDKAFPWQSSKLAQRYAPQWQFQVFRWLGALGLLALAGWLLGYAAADVSGNTRKMNLAYVAMIGGGALLCLATIPLWRLYPKWESLPWNRAQWRLQEKSLVWLFSRRGPRFSGLTLRRGQSIRQRDQAEEFRERQLQLAERSASSLIGQQRFWARLNFTFLALMPGAVLLLVGLRGLVRD